MSDSQFVCWRDGIPLSTHRGSWRHALGRQTGAIPPRRRHKPVPISRAEYDHCFAMSTPPDEARAIAARMREEDARINAGELPRERQP